MSVTAPSLERLLDARELREVRERIRCDQCGRRAESVVFARWRHKRSGARAASVAFSCKGHRSEGLGIGLDELVADWAFWSEELAATRPAHLVLFVERLDEFGGDS